MIRLDYHLFGGNPFRLPALPNAIWFFGASKESYLSFKNPSTGGFDAFASQTAGNGIPRAIISFAKVSSVVDPCRAYTPLLAQEYATIDESCHC